jgi:hypothetical protein
MIPSLPYILISLLALALLLSIYFLVRSYRRSISAFEDRLQALESEQLRIDQAMSDQTAKISEENASKITKLKEDIKAFFTSAIESVQKKAAENAAAYENQLDLLSAQIITLQQRNKKESSPVEAPESVAPAQSDKVRVAQPAQPSEVDQANTKAKRLARLIVSEIALYNRKVLEEGVRTNRFDKLLEHDIKEARALYARRVPEEIRNSTSYLDEAFTELVAKTRRELNL